jgi:hypothetical protein
VPTGRARRNSDLNLAGGVAGDCRHSPVECHDWVFLAVQQVRAVDGDRGADWPAVDRRPEGRLDGPCARMVEGRSGE